MSAEWTGLMLESHRLSELTSDLPDVLLRSVQLQYLLILRRSAIRNF